MEDTEVVRNKYVPISIMTTEMRTTVGPLKSLSTQFRSLLHDMKVLVLRQNMSRLAMLSCCVLGLVFALSHHLFYRHLDTTVVKTKNDQEWALRFGNAFALIVKTALIATISIAYTQHIWTVVRRKAVTVEGIDAIIAASNDFFAFLNREMWSKSLVGAVVAGLLWVVPVVVTILPPASLSVRSILLPATISLQVPVPVYNDKAYTELSNTLVYKGSGISRLIYSSAISVAVIPMNPPFPSVSYAVDFYGPSFRCALSRFDRPPDVNNHSVIEVYNFSTNTSNVLSIYTRLDHKYIQCALYNTSFHTVFSFENNSQSAESTREFINPVKYPGSMTDTRDIPFSLPYQGWMDPISDLLRGVLLKDDDTDSVAWYSSISLTGLVYSSDTEPLLRSQLHLDPSFSTPQLSKPLEALMEDFSVNMTLSLFSSSLLSPSIYTTAVTVESPVNIYTYNRESLLLPYLASFACAVLAILVGERAFKINGKSQSASFSSIVRATRNKELDALLVNECSGTEPSTGQVARRQLQFAQMRDQSMEHWAFQLR